jgi:putative redox protein
MACEGQMKATVKWLDNMSFVGESGSGHSVVMDGPPEAGGRNMGVRPMEMVLLGMGGCTAFDVVMILKRSRQDIVDCHVELEAERAAEVPKVFTKIHVHYIIKGRQLNEKQVARAVNLTAEKYCSVSIMLAAVAEVTHDYEIVDV